MTTKSSADTPSPITNNNNKKDKEKSIKAAMSPEEDTRRFEVELEFVQCLASPSYLNFLAQNEYFDNPDFIAYLNYLQYWRIPQYARFVMFPHALYFLQLLQDSTFREAIKRDDFALMVHQQQGWNWQFEKSFKQKSGSETVNGNIPQQPQPQQPGGETATDSKAQHT